MNEELIKSLLKKAEEKKFDSSFDSDAKILILKNKIEQLINKQKGSNSAIFYQLEISTQYKNLCERASLIKNKYCRKSSLSNVEPDVGTQDSKTKIASESTSKFNSPKCSEPITSSALRNRSLDKSLDDKNIIDSDFCVKLLEMLEESKIKCGKNNEILEIDNLTKRMSESCRNISKNIKQENKTLSELKHLQLDSIKLSRESESKQKVFEFNNYRTFWKLIPNVLISIVLLLLVIILRII